MCIDFAKLRAFCALGAYVPDVSMQFPCLLRALNY